MMMTKTLTVCACVLVLAGGCQEEETPQRRAPSYTDKTPEEWLDLIGHQRSQVRERAVAALVQYGQGTVPGLVAVLRDKTAGPGRLSAARALSGIGPDAGGAVPALAEALAETDWRARDAAAEALGKIGQDPDRTIPALIGALEDPDERVRGEAAQALGRIRHGSPQVVAALAAALEDENENVCAYAADALQVLGPGAKAAVPALEKAAGAESFVVRQAAQEALKAIRGH